MKIYKEVDSTDFEFWAGARDTVAMLTEQELSTVWRFLEEDCVFNMNTPTETDINDFFWFERDTIADLLGYSDWEALIEER